MAKTCDLIDHFARFWYSKH